MAVPYWAKRNHRPYIVSPHGMLDAWALANSKWKKRIAGFAYEQRHLRGAACLHALCTSEAESMRAYGLINPIAVIPNGVALPEENPESGKRKPESGRKTLLFLGRLHPKKGLENALRAWANFNSQRPRVAGREEWQFVIAGWDQGGHEAELKQLCRDLGLAYTECPASEFVTKSKGRETKNNSPSLFFTGPAFGEQKDQLLRHADAFILPSFSEGLPMSVLEAWAYKLPVLMTDHCNLPEGFSANAAVRIGTSVEDMGTGLRNLIEAPESRLHSLGANGRQLVTQRFTWQRIATQMTAMYQWVLGTAPKPDFVE